MTETLFAPADRASPETLASEAEVLRTLTAFCASIDAMPVLVLVLNAQRQIVAANRRLYETLKTTPVAVLGHRPGELVHCIGAVEGLGGCGTAERCRLCGAVNSILKSVSTSQQVTEECRLMLQENSSVMDLEAVATPFAVAGHSFTIFSLRDISGDKRREVLERLFFHDVTNTAGNITGLTRLMLTHGATESDLRLLSRVGGQLLEEIQSHRDLIAAEQGSLVPNPCSVILGDILDQVWTSFSHPGMANDRHVVLEPMPAITAQTDPVLLRRVVANLVKNGIEASQRGETVTISLHDDETAAIITVQNPAVMQPEVRQQVFQRSFSTKGKGRGLGTYGSHLLVERYMGGSLTCASITGQGTIMAVRIPIHNPSAA